MKLIPRGNSVKPQNPSGVPEFARFDRIMEIVSDKGGVS